MNLSDFESYSMLGIYSALLLLNEDQLANLKKCEDAVAAQTFTLNVLMPKALKSDEVLELGEYYEPILRILAELSMDLQEDSSLNIYGDTRLFDEPYFSAGYSSYRSSKKMAESLSRVTRERLRSEYDLILSKDPSAVTRTPYGPEVVHGDRDFELTWKQFISLEPFFAKASALERDVVFTLHGNC